jgi:hypothetical protein
MGPEWQDKQPSPPRNCQLEFLFSRAAPASAGPRFFRLSFPGPARALYIYMGRKERATHR